MSMTEQTFGWFSRAAALASCRKRARSVSVYAWRRGRNFSATIRSSLVSWALYTMPIPPSPSFSKILYCDTVRPIIVSSQHPRGNWRYQTNPCLRRIVQIGSLAKWWENVNEGGLSVDYRLSAYSWKWAAIIG